MRPDQIEQLKDLSERLADVFIQEADPVNWSGAGKLPSDMTKDERGDRVWEKRGAMATGGVLKYVIDLSAQGKGTDINDPEEQRRRETEFDNKLSDAERRAEEAIKKIQKKAKA